MNDMLKDTMLLRVPELSEDYKQFVRNRFAAMQKDLGIALRGVRSSWTWARTYDAIRGNLYQDFGGRSAIPYTESLKLPYKIHEEALERNAQKYGERVALEWYNKMRGKLGDLRIIRCYVDAQGTVIITGQIKEHNITVEQNRIINVSSRGLLFHQFPARIYVDGKFVSEAKYKKMMRVKEDTNA